MVKHLPEINLKEISESESEADDEDVLPLDFRTAMLEKDNKVVIQAKPLTFKPFREDEEIKSSNPNISMDAYLEAAKKEAFKEDEGAVMIDPDINIREKFA